MNREKLDLWLREISTPTGLSYSGDRTLSNSEVDTILEYVDNLQSKIDKAIEYIEKSMNNPQPFYEYLFGDENGKVENLDKLLEILKEDK